MLQGVALTQGGRLHKAVVCCKRPFSAGAGAYTNRPFDAIHRSRQHHALKESVVCCNPPFSAALRLTQNGRLLQSTALGSAAPYTNWSLAAFGPSWQRHALQELVVCCNPPFSAAPRFTGIGRLLQSAVLGDATPYANRSFEANGNRLPWQSPVPSPDHNFLGICRNTHLTDRH